MVPPGARGGEMGDGGSWVLFFPVSQYSRNSTVLAQVSKLLQKPLAASLTLQHGPPPPDTQGYLSKVEACLPSLFCSPRLYCEKQPF